MATVGGPPIRLYRAEWSTNCERVGLALAHKKIEVRSVIIAYSNRAPVEAVSGQPLVPAMGDSVAIITASWTSASRSEPSTPTSAPGSSGSRSARWPTDEKT
jgi:hypothetical protein